MTGSKEVKMLTLEKAIKHCEEVAEKNEKECKWISGSEDAGMNGALAKTFAECAAEHRQLAKWLRELQRYRFEISECKAILDNPTPDVTENDRKRAMYVLQTFPDVRGDER